MPTEENIKFSFTSTSQPDDTFMVAEFNGKEAISKLYEFEIVVYADDPDIDLKEVLKNPVKLTVVKDGEELRVFHGILSRFEQLHEYSGHVYFRAILVPRLWIADQYLENQLFLDKSVPDIIEEVLKQTGLTSNDYELKLTGSYDPWEYICQYNESDFNFISRWMEREGIYYYFEQGDDAEKLIIADASTAHEDITSDSIRYSPPDSLAPSTTEQIREFTCHQQLMPKKVVLKDYNYRKPSLDLKGEADVDPDGRGNVYIYGEHFKTPEQGNGLATIRAEELLCREALFYGEGTVPPFLTGYIFELHDHYRDSYNQRYLITELSHEGVQSTYLTGAGADDQNTESQGPSYFNNFSCIPADTQFRPERLADKPKLKGTLNGSVDAGGDGEYAEIDDEGRYKVKLPFDQGDSEDGKASRWVRMAQPYAGADYGMHFPLHKGTEVLLTFIDGDPDRPIISGTVPNPETGSPVTGANQTQSMIRTAGGNQIRIEDSAGGQQIHMSSPTQNSIISLGEVNEGNIFLRSDGTWVARIGDDATEFIQGNKDTVVEGNEEKAIWGGQLLEVTGQQGIKVAQDQLVEIAGMRRVNAKGGELYEVNSGRTLTVNGNDHYDVNGPRAVHVTGNEDYTIDGNRTVNVGGNHKGLNAGVTIAHYWAATLTAYLGVSTAFHASVDNDVHAGISNKGFLGLSIEHCAAIKMGHTAGLDLTTKSASIADEGASIKNIKSMSLRKAAAYLFL